MSELTFIIEYLRMNNEELEEYIRSLNGVCEVGIDSEKNEIYIKYDSKLISVKLLLMEVKLFLNLTNTPAIVCFDKHSKKDLKSTSVFIEDICCEYCLKGAIEDLLETDGIESANTCPDFDIDNSRDVSIEVKYDKEIFDENEIKKLVLKFLHL